jgi:amino acid adenylation domain-containing protein
MMGIATRSALPLDHDGPVGPFDPFPTTALDAPLPARFAHVAARSGARLAVVDALHRLTYTQLATLAARIAAALPARAPTGPDLIGILLEHEARFPAAMLGVLAAGHAYVPLDASYPPDRIAAIAAHAGLTAIICSQALWPTAAALAAPGVGVVSIDALPAGTDDPSLRPHPLAEPGDVASILYTSGSTGEPKGVYQDHRGLLHDVMQYANAAHIGPNDRLTLLYSPGTAGAVRDIWGALLTGASLHVLPPRDGAEALAGFLRRTAPTLYHSVPVLMRHLAHASERAGHPPFPSVRLGYIAGDRLDATDVRAFFRLFPKALLYTGLGATEASTIYVHRFIRPGTPLPDERVPVGRAMPEREALLLDPDGEPVRDGEVGEIVVASRYIARGYWRAPDLTAERFGPDPGRPGWRRFRTGDMGRLRPEDGLLEHLGRADHMVKIGGQRIELPAVEAALKALPEVREATALVRPPRTVAAQPILVAHWQPASSEPVPDRALLMALRRTLPPAMVPAVLVRCAALPLLPNFKVDRAAVALADAALVRAGDEHRMPGSGAAWEVADEAARQMGVDGSVGLDGNVLALGMDSIALMEFTAGLERRLGRIVPLEVILAAGTPRRIGGWLDATSPLAAPGAAALVTLRQGPDPARTPLLWPHDLGGDVFDRVPALFPMIPPDRDWLGLRDPAGRDRQGAAETLEDHATLLLAMMREAGLSPKRGGIPIGWSFAGRLAWELASQMLSVGWNVPCVVVLDAPPWPTGIGPDFAEPYDDRQALRAHGYKLAAGYHARAAALDLVLVRASGTFGGVPEDLGWAALARRVTILRVPGDHAIFRSERIAATAAALCEALGTLGGRPA